MTIQYSTAHRNANMNDITTQAGTGAYFILYTGSVPATCATTASGTQLAALPCSNPFAAGASAGLLTASSITNETATNTGTAGYWRLCTDNTGTTCVAQGTIFQTLATTTNNSTAADGNTLSFASVSGISVGMTVAGTGIVTGTTVVAISGTTVYLSLTSTAGVANGASITFGGDMSMANTSITSGETISISSWTDTATGA